MTKPRARTILAVVSVAGYILLTGAFFTVLFFGSRINLPDGELGKQIIGMLGMIVGTWNAVMLMVYTFNYGTSQGSQDKGDVQNEILKKIGNTGAV